MGINGEDTRLCHKGGEVTDIMLEVIVEELMRSLDTIAWN